MRNHIVFKFLAILLCALCLTSALFCAAGIVGLMTLNLGPNESPEQKQREWMEDSLQVDAQALVTRSLAKSLGKADDLYLRENYGYLDRVLAYMTYDYKILDSQGKVVEQTEALAGNFPDLTCIVRAGIRYPSILKGPTFVDSEEEMEAVENQFLQEAPTRDDGDIFAYAGYNSQGKGFVYKGENIRTTEDYTVVFHIDMANSDMSIESRLWTLAGMVWRHQTLVIVMLGVSLLLFAVLAVYLCIVAGRKPGREEIRPGGLNCLSLEIYLAAVVGLTALYVYLGMEGADWLMQQSMGLMLACYGYGSYACCLVFVGFCFACAAQFKTPGCYWWHHSVTGLCWRGVCWCWHFGWKCIGWAYRILWKVTLALLLWGWEQVKKLWHFLGKILGKVLGWIKRLYELLPLSWQWLVGGLIVGGCTFPGLITDSNFLLLLSFLAAMAVVLYGSSAFGTLLEAVKRMRGGDLDVKVDDKLMVGGFKDMAGELNGLSDVVLVAAQKQMRSERMRTELITNVSHDIKTPLTSIINYVDLLQKPHTEEEGKAYLEVLSRQSGRMKRLIDDLIELSKASTGNITVELTKMDAVETVNQALGEFTDKLAAAELMPVFRQPKEPLYIHADGRLAWRAMSNLLSNAVKYAQPGTRLYVDMVAVDGKVCISFKNISRDPLNVSADELMERFVRGEASRNQEGSGLGLNIAQSMMELQHGALELLVDGDLFKATLIFPQEEE